MTDILESDLGSYLKHGGLCKAVVQGTMHDACNHEPGWLVNSTEYLRVSWLMEEPEDLEEQIRRYNSENTTEGVITQRR